MQDASEVIGQSKDSVKEFIERFAEDKSLVGSRYIVVWLNLICLIFPAQICIKEF